MNLSAARVFLALALLGLVTTACSGGRTTDPAIGRQLTGNQAVLMSLQNSVDITTMFLPYNGPEAPGARTASPQYQTGGVASGTVQIGELNLLLHNVGGSSTAGHLFVSGYDPNLIEVEARLGEDPIGRSASGQSCVHNVILGSGGQYDVMVFCDRNDGLAIGGRQTSGPNGQSTTITVGNLPIDQWLNDIASSITGQNVGWFTRNGLFGTGRADCTSQNGQQACRLVFGNPGSDPNRALYGFLLLNMLYPEITNVEGCHNCRVFPPRFGTGQVLMGVSDEYPGGDSLYANYDIFVKRENWPSLLNELPQRLQITACYYYTTTITPVVCVDPDPSSRRNDPCDAAAPMIWKGSQGAPIQVSRIQPRSVPGGTMFDIELKHVGSGQYWQPGSLEECGPYGPGRPNPARRDVAQLLDARVAGDLAAMRCTPMNEDGQVLVRFQNGVGRVSCFLSLGQTPTQSRQAYQTPLTLEFGYLYQNVISKDVLIRRT